MSDLTPRQRFDALPEKVKEAAFDKHRYWNVDGGYDWWGGVYEGFVEDMKAAGIEIDRKNERFVRGRGHSDPAIYFSGFCCQGDGACFEGRVADWSVVLVLHDFPLLLQHRDEFGVMGLHWTSSGNYCHENTLSFDEQDTYPTLLMEDSTESELRQIARAQLKDELVAEWERFVKVFEEIVKNYCRKLYKDLEAEHDHLTSDETVLDSLEASDMLTEIIEEHENEESESA